VNGLQRLTVRPVAGEVRSRRGNGGYAEINVIEPGWIGC